VAVKGHSASGKSVTVDKVLALFPREAVIKMTGMSERALIYSEEEYVHRTIVIVEADALRERSDDNNLTAYFLRSLLSEGRIDYQVTERKGGKFVTRTITKEGPTNVVFTTTRPRVEYQNETRVLSLTTDDSRAQTARILIQLADEPEQTPDLAEWLHLQQWLQQHGERRVTIPYALRLAELVPPVAVRLRRDFGAVLTLIRAHALLHQLTRDRDHDDRIVATLDDYATVRDLVADIVSEGVGAAVSETTRATAEAVADLAPLHPGGVTAAVLGDKLGLDKSAARRRLYVAGGGDYVKNLEERRGRPGRWVIAEPLPEQVEILPPPTALIDGGTVAVVPEGENDTPEDYLLNESHSDDPTEPHTWPEPEEEL
jgi:hypothetical protein